MKTYELTYLILPELSLEEAQGLISKIEPILRKEDGALIENKVQKTIRLGYQIKNKKQAHLAILVFQINPEKIRSFQKNLREIPEILRFLISIVKPVRARKEVPKKQIQKETSKETLKEAPEVTRKKPALKEKKVELTEIEKKLEEILGE